MYIDRSFRLIHLFLMPASEADGSWVIDTEVLMDVPEGAAVEGSLQIRFDVTNIRSKQHLHLTSYSRKIKQRVHINRVNQGRWQNRLANKMLFRFFVHLSSFCLSLCSSVHMNLTFFHIFYFSRTIGIIFITSLRGKLFKRSCPPSNVGGSKIVLKCES